ncbi:MAG: AMP-binding protein [Beijerinckiaceae bacterium]|nr:AMP-binding protein [Beijerinckiaceae bacterium]
MAEALQLPHIASLQVMTGLDNWICEARRSISSSTGDVGFRTSGSTGARKFTVHNFDALAQEIGCLSAVFSDRARIVSLVPAHHIYGFLFTILLPLKLGVEVVDARSQAPATVHSMAKAGDLIVAFPDWWRLLENATWPPDVEGSSSGAPCPVALAQAHRKNGLRLVEVYGSTETGGVGWRDDATAPFRLLPYWERDGDDAVRKLVRGAMKRYALPDLVSWSGNAHLKPVARFDGAVQVGGVNVYPDAVRAALLAHPAVADAAVRLMRPDEGQRLKAFIVSRDAKTPTDELHHALEAWVAERLQPMERPRAFTFGASLPTNAMGKSADWLIAQS